MADRQVGLWLYSCTKRFNKETKAPLAALLLLPLSSAERFGPNVDDTHGGAPKGCWVPGKGKRERERDGEKDEAFIVEQEQGLARLIIRRHLTLALRPAER